MLTIPLAIIAARRTARRVRQLEQRARANERLAELGTLTGGLAHEIKNPLSSINLNVQLIEEDLRDLARQSGSAAAPAASAAPTGVAASAATTPSAANAPASTTQHTQHPPISPSPHAAQQSASSAGFDDRLGRIRRRFESLSRETRRLRDILDDFLRFAGRMKLDLAPVDLNLLVSEVADFFQPQAQAMAVTLRTQLSPAPLAVPADASLLKQAIFNLMINGCQAMANARAAPNAAASAAGSAESSSVASASPDAHAAAPRTGDAAQVHAGVAPSEMIVRLHRPMLAQNDGIEIHVIDTGPGIAPADLPRIFQPYFSTKKGGTGLGLPTARRIVEEHGGTLTVHTEPGRGSDFIIRLPATREAAALEA